ncbi:hypothetical protein L7F22_035569 [Adiantum nelumboides]|nr:hypothetical protein [Adiantum nelumboides]
MFYSHFILARKGPLGTIWIAAHLEGKLRKNQVTETNISASVDSILFPDVPIALRLSGHLLLGIVRIYSRKVNYLYHDCSEAFVKIKQAFHGSRADLPPEASKVPFHSITLPENFEFHDLDGSFNWDKLHTLSGKFMDDHVSARDSITLREQTQEQSHVPLFDPDERFPGSSDPYSLLHESNKEQAGGLPSASSYMLLHQEREVSALEEDILPPLPVNEEMELDREELIQINQGVLSPTRENARTMQNIPDVEKLRAAPEPIGPEPLFMELDDQQGIPNSNTPKLSKHNGSLDELGLHDLEVTPVLNEIPLSRRVSPFTGSEYDKYTEKEDLLGEILGGRTPTFEVASPFGAVPESARQKKKRRKRKPIFDDNPNLSSMAMKKQLAGAGDLLRQRSKTPRTDYGARGLGMPNLPGLSAPIRDLYSRITGFPSKDQSSSLPVHAEIYTQHHENRDRDPGAEFPVGDTDLLDSAEAPLSFRHSSPQYAQHISTNNGEENDVDNQEAQTENNNFAIDGQQEKCMEDAETGRHLQDVRNTLPNLDYPSESSGQGKNMLLHPEALTRQSSNVSAHANDALPKLDFLEASRDNGLFAADAGPEDPFIDETASNSRSKEEPPQNSYGWSVRTRFVAKYLKSIFEELEATSSGSQPVQVSLDSLLRGRPRKEAARMYFETLVLKSRGYVDVEQKTGFAEIILSTTHLLRKVIL